MRTCYIILLEESRTHLYKYIVQNSFRVFRQLFSMDVEDGESILYTQPSKESVDKWLMLGQKLPKDEIVFFTQAIVIFIVIISAIVNISIGNSSETWLVLLSTAVGAILPNPKLRTSERPSAQIIPTVTSP